MVLVTEMDIYTDNCSPGLVYGVLGGAGAGALFGGVWVYGTVNITGSGLYRVTALAIGRGFIAGGAGAVAGIGYQTIINKIN